MSTESNTSKSSPLDYIKWLLAVVVFAAAVWGNGYYTEVATLYRVLAVVALMLVSAGIALTSSQGKDFLQLLKEANIERRKVVWPTRQETTQTTLIVVGVVFLMGLVLWGLDSLLGWLVSLLIG
ncbi:preprotein translocase subunit SecE [Bacterioplanes sanyensis]|uniref:Protein translocase subunit SecE n=1 Tax=Bacterioplanes sanyensis TaxID=1249553 RepID=A0A222FHK9_9GAMM|nr:preprotein translocase subunit SecE [Bacterioplanes sanyensis]ASP38250.1 preprotein translocase subunit SecE [Bacterioplanes sanyensis]